MADVVYNLSSDDGVIIARRHTMLLPPWAGMASNAEAVAVEVCEEHLDEATWTRFFSDSFRGCVAVEVLSPAEVAGHYRVEVVLKPKATAKKVKS